MDNTFGHINGTQAPFLDRVIISGGVYFIGMQLAKLLKRTTFNLYRAMRASRVRLKRASPQHLHHFKQKRVPFLGPSNRLKSITFLPLEQTLEFLATGLSTVIGFVLFCCTTETYIHTHTFSLSLSLCVCVCVCFGGTSFIFVALSCSSPF